MVSENKLWTVKGDIKVYPISKADSIKKPHIAVRLGITGGEYRIRTDHLLPARQAL